MSSVASCGLPPGGDRIHLSFMPIMLGLFTLLKSVAFRVNQDAAVLRGPAQDADATGLCAAVTSDAYPSRQLSQAFRSMRVCDHGGRLRVPSRPATLYRSRSAPCLWHPKRLGRSGPHEVVRRQDTPRLSGTQQATSRSAMTVIERRPSRPSRRASLMMGSCGPSHERCEFRLPCVRIARRGITSAGRRSCRGRLLRKLHLCRRRGHPRRRWRPRPRRRS